MSVPDLQRDRYSRQILFPPIGPAGQERLSGASVLVVGCGALGSGILELLARAGIGDIRFIDRDFVEPSNLQRQSLYTEDDARARRPKALAAAEALRGINASLRYTPLVKDFHPGNALELAAGVHLILDGTDNMETRFLLNEVSVKTGTPWVYGGCVAAGGVSAPIVPGKTPCLRCLLPTDIERGELPTCDTLGIIAPAARIVSALEVTWALRLLTGGTEAIEPYMLHFDLWAGDFFRMDLQGAQNPDCPVCVHRHLDKLGGENASRAVVLCGRNMVQLDFPSLRPGGQALDLALLAERLAPVGDVSADENMLVFSLPPHQLILFPDGRCLVKGTSNPDEAKSLYSRYIGN